MADDVNDEDEELDIIEESIADADMRWWQKRQQQQQQQP